MQEAFCAQIPLLLEMMAEEEKYPRRRNHVGHGDSFFHRIKLAASQTLFERTCISRLSLVHHKCFRIHITSSLRITSISTFDCTMPIFKPRSERASVLFSRKTRRGTGLTRQNDVWSMNTNVRIATDAVDSRMIGRVAVFLGEQIELGLSKQEIAKRVQAQLNTEYVERAFQTIENSQELERLSPGLGRLLVAHARSTLVMKSVVEKLTDDLDKHLKAVRSRFSSPVLIHRIA